jgi:hypothetical protein
MAPAGTFVGLGAEVDEVIPPNNANLARSLVAEMKSDSQPPAQ